MYSKNITVFDHFLKDTRLLIGKIPVKGLNKRKLVSLTETSDAWAAKAVIFTLKYLKVLDKDRKFFEGIKSYYEEKGFLSSSQVYYVSLALKRYYDNIWTHLNLMEDWSKNES